MTRSISMVAFAVFTVAACSSSGARLAPSSGLRNLTSQAEKSAKSTAARIPVELTRASASNKTTAELALLLLPDHAAGQFTSHELIHHNFPGDELAGVRFFARPTPLADDLCLQELTYVDLQPVDRSTAGASRRDVPMEFERLLPAVQIAAVPGCVLRSDDLFARVQPATALAGAEEALRRLLLLQQAARGPYPLDADVTCRTESSSTACDAAPRALLASLLLRRVQIIDRQAGGWKMSVVPNRPGEHHWEVLLSPNDAPNPKVRLVWRIPAPF